MIRTTYGFVIVFDFGRKTPIRFSSLRASNCLAISACVVTLSSEKSLTSFRTGEDGRGYRCLIIGQSGSYTDSGTSTGGTVIVCESVGVAGLDSGFPLGTGLKTLEGVGDALGGGEEGVEGGGVTGLLVPGCTLRVGLKTLDEVDIDK